MKFITNNYLYNLPNIPNRKNQITNSPKKFFLFTLTIFLLINSLFCDLPVHCRREEIEGHWTFRINKHDFDLNLNKYQSTCGHGFPDKIEKLENDINYSFENFEEIEVYLESDYTIKDPYTKESKGKWTPIYDEGFIVNYENSSFTAFMKYYLKPLVSSRKSKFEEKDYLSNCQKTMIGWYQKDLNTPDKNWACFFGYKNIISEEFNYPSKDSVSNNDYNKNKGYKRIPKYALRPNKDFSNFQKLIFNKQLNSYEIETLANKRKKNKNLNRGNNNNDNNISDISLDDESYDDIILKESFNKMMQSKFEENEEEEENYSDDSDENSDLDEEQEKEIQNSNKDYFISNDYYNNNNQIKKESFLEVKIKSKSKLKLEELKYENQIDFVNEINSNRKLSWKAHLHKEFKGYNFLELKNKLGMKNLNSRRKLSNRKINVDRKIKTENFEDLISKKRNNIKNKNNKNNNAKDKDNFTKLDNQRNKLSKNFFNL